MLLRPLPQMRIPTFVSNNPHANQVMTFDFPDRADKCLRRPLRFSVPVSDQLIRQLSTDIHSMLYGDLKTVNRRIDLCISKSMRPLLLAATGLTDNM